MKNKSKLVLLMPVLMCLSACQGIYFQSFKEGIYSFDGTPIATKENGDITLQHFDFNLRNITEEEYKTANKKNVVQNLYDYKYFAINFSIRFSDDTENEATDATSYGNDNRVDDSYLFLLNLSDPNDPLNAGLGVALIPHDSNFIVYLISKSTDTTKVENWRISFTASYIVANESIINS